MKNWAALIRKFKSAKCLVIGDVCLDRWCRYEPELSIESRETGIPRIGVTASKVTPGAAGTVANNLASLGAGKVSVLGAIGQDGFGFELERALSKRGIDYHMVVATDEIQTFTYTKVINAETGIEDKPRIDFVNNRPLPGDVEDQLIANFSSAYRDYDLIFVADQAETKQGGVVTPAFREVLADAADRGSGAVMVVDSRARIHHFRNAICKPNEDEARAASRALFGEVDYERLRQALGGQPLIVTRGDRGALIVSEDGERTIPALALGDPVDFCGAGDAFGAGLGLAVQAGADIVTAARFGSLVSGVTVMKAGTGEATPDEVLAAADSLAVNG